MDWSAKSVARMLLGITALACIMYAIYAGLSAKVPYQNPINGQTARNLFYHVPLWFAGMLMGYASVVYSILYLRKQDLKWDILAHESARLMLLFGLLGLATGIVWSRVTWGDGKSDLDPQAWWPWDPKQTSAMICVLIYAGYMVLRRSFDDPGQRAKIAGVYNIFAAAAIYPLFYAIPKAMGGQHPNTGSDPTALKGLSSSQSGIFWIAVLGSMLLAIWILDIRVRYRKSLMAIETLEDNA
ncbi:MAG: cytochrome c biogenesis protein CcsA [Bacteroidia bacterium]